MTPREYPLTIWRGVSLEVELISQIKNWVFDPALHNAAIDLKRTHAENLEEYGFTYEYINFAALYTEASLVIRKPWVQDGQSLGTPLEDFSVTSGHIELTTNSVKIGMTDEETAAITYDKGIYKLKLMTAAGKVDCLTFGDVTVQGAKEV